MKGENWESLLNRYIEQAKTLTFEWGQADCALWCSDWVKLATGTDFTTPWRGQYATEAELSELLAARGFAGPQDIPDSVGLPDVHPAFARRGDIVLNAQGCLGICNGIYSYFLMERGLTPMKTRNCPRAWAIR